VMGYSILLLGGLLVYLAPFLYFVGIFVLKRPRNLTHQMGYSLVIVSGVLVFLYGIIANRIFPGMLNLILIALVPIGWWVYIYVYSVFGRKKSNTLKTGNRLTELFFEDVSGNPVSSNSFSGRYAVLLFYRGNWCPFCMAQIKEMTQYYEQLKELNTEVYLISPQKLSYSQNLARKFSIDMHFLRDTGNKAAGILGIIHENGTPVGFDMLGYERDTVLPTIIILNTNGKIIYTDQTNNYRIRPEPEEFIDLIHKERQKG
jgi:peroxiredoxin